MSSPIIVAVIKLKIKRIICFFKHGGFKYLSVVAMLQSFLWLLSNCIKFYTNKTIYWIGPFSPIHANVGDHAQTQGVQNFLRDKFGDYRIVRVYRDDINEKLLATIASRLKSTDLIFLHSSGDFGSLHDVPSHHPGRISYPEVRRQIVAMAPTAKIINLPTTVYYDTNSAGLASLSKDRNVFNGSDLTVLCREPESLRVARENLECKSMFFPDFVFYLKPRLHGVQRKGVLAILRNDKEALLSSDERLMLIEQLGLFFGDVEVNDIMQTLHTVPDFILNTYMEGVFRKFQERELIVTDKMHGMITAVITQTPCIALSGGIPHKIKAYKEILAGAVVFVDDVSDIEDAIQSIRKHDCCSVDLSRYFEKFRVQFVDI